MLYSFTTHFCLFDTVFFDATDYSIERFDDHKTDIEL